MSVTVNRFIVMGSIATPVAEKAEAQIAQQRPDSILHIYREGVRVSSFSPTPFPSLADRLHSLSLSLTQHLGGWAWGRWLGGGGGPRRVAAGRGGDGPRRAAAGRGGDDPRGAAVQARRPPGGRSGRGRRAAASIRGVAAQQRRGDGRRVADPGCRATARRAARSRRQGDGAAGDPAAP